MSGMQYPWNKNGEKPTPVQEAVQGPPAQLCGDVAGDGGNEMAATPRCVQMVFTMDLTGLPKTQPQVT
jgi:hypothetical protein